MSSFLLATVFASLFLAFELAEGLNEKNPSIRNDGEETAIDNFNNSPINKRNAIEDSSTNGDHWCCSINTTKQTLVSSVKLIYTTQAVQVASNYSCGFLGLQICTNHHTEYKAVSSYVTSYTTKMIQTQCPNEYLVCCNGSVHLAGKCIPLHEASQVLGTLG